jgi:hypothetical protein
LGAPNQARPWTEVHVYHRRSLRDQVRVLGVA